MSLAFLATEEGQAGQQCQLVRTGGERGSGSRSRFGFWHLRMSNGPATEAKYVQWTPAEGLTLLPLRDAEHGDAAEVKQ